MPAGYYPAKKDKQLIFNIIGANNFGPGIFYEII